MKKTLFIIIILSSFARVFAGDDSRKGTTGAEQLLIPVGARGIAMGEAFLSNIRGIEALYYNPAGLAHQTGSEAMFNYMNYIADINMAYFAISTNLEDIGSLALSFKTFDFGDIPVTTFESPDGNGSTYSPSFLTAGLTYSKVVTDRVSIGVTAKVISETIVDVSAVGFAIDFGVQYKFQDNFHLGATVKNVGTNMEYSGGSLQTKTIVTGSQIGSPNGVYEVVPEAFQLPSYFELGLGYTYDIDEQNQIDLASTFRSNNAFEDQMRFGFEYGFNRLFFIRGGYNLLLENASENTFGLSLGAGINYSLSEGFNVAFDYAFRDVKDFPTSNHIFTIKLAFQ